MSKILINYADKRYYEAQKMNCTTGINPGGFDKVIPYGRKDLDAEFVQKNVDILKESKGAGYWIWKPYIILKTLREVKDNVIVCYSDSGSYFTGSMDPIFKLIERHGIMSFEVGGCLEKTWTKRDIFIHLGCDTDTYKNTFIRNGAFIGFKNNSISREFVTKWLKYCEITQLVTDHPSKLGADDVTFKENRYDQSIYSILCKKDNIPGFPDPSQFGEDIKYRPYPTLLFHHRTSGSLNFSGTGRTDTDGQRSIDVIISPFSGTSEDRRSIAQSLRQHGLTVFDNLSLDQNLEQTIAKSKVLVSVSPFHDQGMFLALNKNVCVIRVPTNDLFDDFYSGLTIVTPHDQLVQVIISTIQSNKWIPTQNPYKQDFFCLDVLNEEFYAFCCDWTDTKIQS